jgi:hypothetical protein
MATNAAAATILKRIVNSRIGMAGGCAAIDNW